MGIYRIKGKVDSDHNTITTTITSNLTTKRTIEQNQQQRGMEGVQQRNNQVVKQNTTRNLHKTPGYDNPNHKRNCQSEKKSQ